MVLQSDGSAHRRVASLIKSPAFLTPADQVLADDIAAAEDREAVPYPSPTPAVVPSKRVLVTSSFEHHGGELTLQAGMLRTR